MNKEKEKYNLVENLPLVSILLPVRNEKNNISKCLANILANDYPQKNIEILIIDGESTDGTLDIINKFVSSYKNIRVCHNPKHLPYTGLNIGLKNATGEIIVRVDSRSIIPRNYINLCVKTLIETGADNVGSVQKQFGESIQQKAIAIATSHPFGIGNASFRLGNKSGYVDTCYLGSFRKTLFEKIGYYDEDGPVISEDASFNRRIIESGGKVYLNKDIVVLYPAKKTLGELCRQYFIYGGAKGHIFLKYKKLTTIRNFVPLLFLSGIAVMLILSFFNLSVLKYLSGFILAYILIDIIVCIRVLSREGNIMLLPYLFLAFPSIHISWVSGFIIRVLEGSRPGKHWRG